MAARTKRGPKVYLVQHNGPNHEQRRRRGGRHWRQIQVVNQPATRGDLDALRRTR